MINMKNEQLWKPTLERIESTSLFKFIEQINELNTEKVEPLSSILNTPLRSREDKIDDGKIRDKILKNSPKKNEEFFVVPKVIE